MPKDLDMAAIAGRPFLAKGLRLGEAITHGRKIARELAGASLADMARAKSGSAAMARSKAAVAPG